MILTLISFYSSCRIISFKLIFLNNYGYGRGGFFVELIFCPESWSALCFGVNGSSWPGFKIWAVSKPLVEVSRN